MPLTPADIRNAVAFTVATVAAAFVVPVVPFAGIPMAAFALGWLTYRFGIVPASALAVAAGVLPVVMVRQALGLSPLDAGFIVIALLASGPGAAWALRRYQAFNVVAVVSIVIGGAFVVSPLGTEVLEGSLEMWRRLTEAIAASGSVADADAFRETASTLLRQMSATYPATSVYNMGLGVLLAVPLISRAAKSLGVQASRYPALEGSDLSFHLVWPTIAGFAMLAASAFFRQGEGLLWTVGTNVLMIVRPALFLQGLAVFASLYHRIGMSKPMRVIGYALLLLLEAIVPSASALGLLDLFANLRKLPRDGNMAPVPQA